MDFIDEYAQWMTKVLNDHDISQKENLFLLLWIPMWGYKNIKGRIW